MTARKKTEKTTYKSEGRAGAAKATHARDARSSACSP